MAKIDGTGFVQKTQNEYFADERDRYLAIDPAWNLDPSSPDGLKLATDSEVWANIEEALLAAYNSKDPDRAMGADLDALMQISGLSRLPGSGSTVVLTVTGASGTVIPAGSRARSSVGGSEWATSSQVTIAGGFATVQSVNVEPGATPADPGDISIIVDPIAGWQGVSNVSPAALGIPPESDARARIRRAGSVGNPGGNQVDATFASIANITGVSHVKIYENETGSTDANGLPPHSTNIIVNGGDDNGIAQAIYGKRGPGAIQYQNATPVDVEVTSPVNGNVKTIKFDRPAFIDAVVVVNITSDGSLPGNAAQLIRDAIINYSVGSIDGVVSAFNQSGYTIGDDVNVSQLYTPVNSVIGSYGGSFVSSMTVNGAASFTVAFNQLSRWSAGNITVNITT